MKKLLFIIVVLISGSAISQNYKITYLRSSNGTLIENQDPIVVFANETQTLLTSQNIIGKNASFPFEQTVVNRKSNSFDQIAVLNTSSSISSIDSISLAKQNFEYLYDTKKILGYNCKKAKTIVNSNTIEFWYTDDVKIKAAPTVLGQNLGLVLEMVRNGNFVISATKVEKVKSIPVI